jgi:hypothetical protein
VNFRNGWKRSHPASPRRSAYGAIMRAAGGLPLAWSNVDESRAAVLDQGSSESCVWNALASCIQDITGGPLISRLAGYAPTRVMGGESRDALVDDGCVPADAVAVASQYGVCLELDWSFDLAKVNIMPSWDVLQRASAYRVTAWERISVAPSALGDELARILVTGKPIRYGQLVGSAYQALQPGAVYSTVEHDGGGHMQKICGYRPSTIPGLRDFRVQNSWGPDWCAGGFSWVSEAVLLDPTTGDFYALDAAPTGIT